VRGHPPAQAVNHAGGDLSALADLLELVARVDVVVETEGTRRVARASGKDLQVRDGKEVERGVEAVLVEDGGCLGDAESESQSSRVGSGI
jgi:hypothetical protein